MRTFLIIWPERRNVSAKQISMWYNDAQENGELDDCDAGMTRPEEQARALHRAGLITLSDLAAWRY